MVLPAKQYLSDRDVACRYSVCRETVWRWTRVGLLPRPVRIGGSTRWNLVDLLDYEQKLS